MKVYDRLKFERQFYDIGLVDIGKLQELNPKVKQGSLAEEVVTDNPYARVFADYLLGRVIKCERVEDLRQYRTAITPPACSTITLQPDRSTPDRWKVPTSGNRR